MKSTDNRQRAAKHKAHEEEESEKKTLKFNIKKKSVAHFFCNNIGEGAPRNATELNHFNLLRARGGSL